MCVCVRACVCVCVRACLFTGAGSGYNPDATDESQDTFWKWLRCYEKKGMRNLRDRNGRTVWFKVGRSVFEQFFENRSRCLLLKTPFSSVS